ncbi:putative membrane protein YeaQ/YmgE (transglycosylase-associated protein family) [Roseiarcus fermentans]|uniref:Putative membrane protein YeaQ/YmgE (Transglycosylase-associated protein family) n=1 Tax=Roseiarcus fermentans TaxID=1473586 RepID=A0A366EJE0_9HYPH|nr:GlsB/YeaQ/YmgE family stress response membrane protein [Roseiarcus fermentans]RBP02537.1 putative membrane protein YeaQ/YmgE (transglycosylase-associated protein family) [Roseiarcus fermentans]
MGVISWIILGLIAGWLAGWFVNKPTSGIFQNLALGVIGAVVGGFLASAVFGTGVTGINIWSIIVSVIGAIVVVWLYDRFAGRRV